MAAQSVDEETRPPAGPAEPTNEVRLVGRIASGPERRDLPSGDELWTFRLVVPRPPGGRSRATVDALECAVWGGRVRRSVAVWREGDVVEVVGSVRRRFFQAAAGAASRYEIEVGGGRLIRRAGSG